MRQLILVDNLEPEVVRGQRENRLPPLEIDVVTVGYRRDGERVVYGLKPQPPLNLDALTVADDADLRTLTTRLDYLALLPGMQNIPAADPRPALAGDAVTPFTRCCKLMRQNSCAKLEA